MSAASWLRMAMWDPRTRISSGSPSGARRTTETFTPGVSPSSRNRVRPTLPVGRL